ncbi:GntR family transcriptional regulator [Micromonospora sp. M12]
MRRSSRPAPTDGWWTWRRPRPGEDVDEDTDPVRRAARADDGRCAGADLGGPGFVGAPYEQVRGQLAELIGDGRLPVGSRLPTVRQLAADLRLAANTVARAYRELEVAGLLETRAATAPSSPGPGRRRRPAAPGCRRVRRRGPAVGRFSDRAVALVRAAVDATRLD